MLTQLRADERETFLENLAQIISPNVGFFIFALLAGLLIGVGFRFEQRALLFAGALVAHQMGPLIGLALSAVTGSHHVSSCVCSPASPSPACWLP